MMIKTQAELADEQAKQAIDDIKAMPPRTRPGNGAAISSASLDEAISRDAVDERDENAQFLAAARVYVERKEARALRWRRLLLGTK